MDSEIDEFDSNHIPPTAVNKNKKIRLEPFPSTNQDELPDHIGPLYICPFLSVDDNKCQVYRFRPTECQIYPFLINRRKSKVFISVDPGCPYAKEKINAKELKEYAEYLGDYFNTPEINALLRSNPQIIQVYDDAVDMVEIKL